MIKRKDKNKEEYAYWTSKRYAMKEMGDMKRITEILDKELIQYMSQHPELSLVSHTFIHDNSTSYYDWVLNAIFIKK